MARTLVCLRYFLLGYVILLGFSGVIVAVGAGVFIYQLYEYGPLTPGDVCGPPAVLLGIGVITCLFGCAGYHVMRFSNRNQVIIFAVVLALLAFVQTCAGIWALVRHEQIYDLPPKFLEEAFALASTDEKDIWDRMQTKLHCCGIDGPDDYHFTGSIPRSCRDTTSLEDSGVSKGSSQYTRGCLHPVINRTRSIMVHVFLLALCSVVLQVTGITCASCQAKAIQEEVDRSRQETLTAVQASAQHRLSDPETNARLLTRPSQITKAR